MITHCRKTVKVSARNFICARVPYIIRGMVEAGEIPLDRMVRAVQRVEDRLQRATAAMRKAGLPYAVIGDCAVMEWIKQADESAVRYTSSVDILALRRAAEAVASALHQSGFIRLMAYSVPLREDAI